MTEYNLRYPVNQKASYFGGENIDFTLSFPNMSLVGNTVRISGKLNVKKGNDYVGFTDKIFYDGMTGIHSFFNNIVVSFQTKGVIETQSDYPRWIKMKHTATRTNSQIISNSKMLAQLLNVNTYKTNYQLDSEVAFCFDLDCCLNNVVSSTAIPYTKTGDITISMRAVQPFEALFGRDMGSTVRYEITDLACEYLTAMTQPQDNQPTTMLMNYSLKQIINSGNANVNIKLPAVVNRVSCSFMRVAEELRMKYNNVELERLPSINKLYYSFNDSTNTFVSYPLESLEDMIQHYLDSFINDDTKNDATLQKLNDNKFFGVGLNFEDSINLLSTSFGINLYSKVTSDDPYYIYTYFKGISQI